MENLNSILEISEVYCSTYGASICLLCASTDHRQCPEVTKLETKVEEARAALAEMAATLSAGETELERAISQLDQHLQDIEARGQLTCGWGTFSGCPDMSMDSKSSHVETVQHIWHSWVSNRSCPSPRLAANQGC